MYRLAIFAAALALLASASPRARSWTVPDTWTYPVGGACFFQCPEEVFVLDVESGGALNVAKAGRAIPLKVADIQRDRRACCRPGARGGQDRLGHDPVLGQWRIDQRGRRVRDRLRRIPVELVNTVPPVLQAGVRGHVPSRAARPRGAQPGRHAVLPDGGLPVHVLARVALH